MLKVLLVVALIAFAVWVLVRLTLRRLDGSGGSRPRVIGPDDDPDFLRGLDRPRDPDDG
ncbi:hypothetical protein SFC79_15725 [Nocardioides sp. S-58]|uniref:Secreted protein n=1 Tax=Nocardioides renjunii TaxID=3095075 RepID=A0ABU5KE27_9ACTN|nr:hypothetical protein [Nocardioides sp. S-58]MDZ5663222.1 hypothetical protein [Nocardioides sp. S-58]